MELVYCYFRVNSGHVFVRPSEAIVVLLEEFNECKAKFRAEACSNLDFVVWVVFMDTYIIEFFYARLVELLMLNRGRL